jgi:Spy/CpxP family protein refolding chaperone
MNAWKAILAAMVIFIAGTVTGGLMVKLHENRSRLHPPAMVTAAGPTMRLEFLKRIERQLNLTSAQRERIEAILRESQERMKALWEPIAPQANAEFQQVRERILAELSPEQKAQFEELSKMRGPRNREAPGNHNPSHKPPRPDEPRHGPATNKTADRPSTH